jgi:hypothetical protein
MKTKIRGGIFHLTKYVLFFSIILLLSCTSTSVMRLEGSDFKENLPGLWDGRWSYGAGRYDIVRLKIINIEGDKVHLTGFNGGGGSGIDADEVYGRIENSTLLLTWITVVRGGCKQELTMIKEDSNNLRLVGQEKCKDGWSAKVRLIKTE